MTEFWLWLVLGSICAWVTKFFHTSIQKGIKTPKSDQEHLVITTYLEEDTEGEGEGHNHHQPGDDE